MPWNFPQALDRGGNQPYCFSGSGWSQGFMHRELAQTGDSPLRAGWSPGRLAGCQGILVSLRAFQHVIKLWIQPANGQW